MATSRACSRLPGGLLCGSALLSLSLSLSLPRATGTTQTKVLAGPRRDKTLAKPELYYAALNILCASTEAKPRGRPQRRCTTALLMSRDSLQLAAASMQCRNQC